MKNLLPMLIMSLMIVIAGANNSRKEMTEKINLGNSWLSAGAGLFDCCKCFRIIDFGADGGNGMMVYECNKSINGGGIGEVRIWLRKGFKDASEVSLKKPIEGGARARFVLLAFSDPEGSDKHLILEVDIASMLGNFDKDQLDVLVSKSGAEIICKDGVWIEAPPTDK